MAGCRARIFNGINPIVGRPGNVIYEATCNCSFNSQLSLCVGPRLGVAYQIDSKTVLRAGGAVATALRQITHSCPIACPTFIRSFLPDPV